MSLLIAACVLVVVFLTKPIAAMRWCLNYCKGCAIAWSSLLPKKEKKENNNNG